MEAGAHNYHDNWVKYYLIPIVAVVTSNIGIQPDEWLQPYILANSLWALFITYIAWWTFKKIYLQFDHLTVKESLKRQLAISIPLVAVIFALLDFVYVRIFWGLAWPEYSDFIQIELPVAIIWLLVFHLIYTIMRLSPSEKIQVLEERTLELQANRGNKIFHIVVADVAYFLVRDKLTFLIVENGDHYSLSQTLNELEHMIGDAFFRANRQLLLRKEAVESYTILPSRKLKLQLKPTCVEDQTVGKMKITEFKTWLSK